jgi:uncharacterized protein
METRTLGRTGLEVGVIGLGTEHLQHKSDVMDAVLGAAVEAGANFVDLLYPDPRGNDRSFYEPFGPLLRSRRDKFVLAAHWGSGETWEVDRCQRCFDDLLAETGNGYAEIGMMTMVDDDAKWNGWAQQSIERLVRYKEQGRIGHIALSGHVTPVALKAVESGLVDVLMFNINMIGHGDPANAALMQACVERGVGLVVMKVYHGGTLLNIGGNPTGITPSQCMAYVLSQPGVVTTVPGPKDATEWQATLAYLHATPEEQDFGPVLAGLAERLAGHCVYCGHCLPCPEGLDIGWLIWHLDQATLPIPDWLAESYDRLTVHASACIECDDCLTRCPFSVDIIGKLHAAADLFGR